MKKHMPHRRYDLDDGFFDSVDTEAKAYWLGFITADGCIRTDHGKNVVQVKLMTSDAGHLEKLKSAVDAQRPLVFADRAGVAGPTAMLALSSRQMVTALADLGVGPRKSMTVRPWDGPPSLMPHYWRGLFDGDGSISRETARCKWTLAICGSLACVEAFGEWGRQICNSTSMPWTQSNVWRWKVAGLGRPQALAGALYSDASVALDRKVARARELLSVDLDAVRAASNARRSAATREAWATGRRSRSLPG